MTLSRSTPLRGQPALAGDTIDLRLSFVAMVATVAAVALAFMSEWRIGFAVLTLGSGAQTIRLIRIRAGFRMLSEELRDDFRKWRGVAR